MDGVKTPVLKKQIIQIFQKFGLSKDHALISAILIGLWAYLGNHRGILLLQIFYATAGIIGMFRWF